MKNPQHIWTSTALGLGLAGEIVDVMLSSNGVAKIVFGGVGGIVTYMHGEYDEDPRKVVAAYKIMMEELEAGLARVEKEKRLANLKSFQKELDSRCCDVGEGNEEISDDDMPVLGGLADGWQMVEDLGEVENKVVYLDRGRRDD